MHICCMCELNDWWPWSLVLFQLHIMCSYLAMNKNSVKAKVDAISPDARRLEYFLIIYCPCFLQSFISDLFEHVPLRDSLATNVVGSEVRGPTHTLSYLVVKVLGYFSSALTFRVL